MFKPDALCRGHRNASGVNEPRYRAVAYTTQCVCLAYARVVKTERRRYYPHMLIGKVWMYRLLFVCLFLYFCVCTVTDFSAEDKASGVKFCTAVHRRRPYWAGNLLFWETLLPRSPKSDESASHREIKFTMGKSTANVTL